MKKAFHSAEKILTRFICYAIVGWLFEEILWIIDDHLLVNRGFLLGPWLPIYGFGGFIICGALYKFAKKPLTERFNIKPLLVFLIVSAAAAAIELGSTYIMDLAGMDFRSLWVYDEYAINFEERIALLPAFQFGLLGCIFLYMSYDRIDRFVKSEQPRTVYLRYVLCALFLIDFVVHLIIGSNYTGNPLITF